MTFGYRRGICGTRIGEKATDRRPSVSARPWQEGRRPKTRSAPVRFFSFVRYWPEDVVAELELPLASEAPPDVPESDTDEPLPEEAPAESPEPDAEPPVE